MCHHALVAFCQQWWAWQGPAGLQGLLTYPHASFPAASPTSCSQERAWARGNGKADLLVQQRRHTHTGCQTHLLLTL